MSSLFLNRKMNTWEERQIKISQNIINVKKSHKKPSRHRDKPSYISKWCYWSTNWTTAKTSLVIRGRKRNIWPHNIIHGNTRWNFNKYTYMGSEPSIFIWLDGAAVKMNTKAHILHRLYACARLNWKTLIRARHIHLSSSTLVFNSATIFDVRHIWANLYTEV